MHSSNVFQDTEELFFQIYKHFSYLLKKIKNPFKNEMNNSEYKIAYTQFALKILPLDYTKARMIF